LAKEAAAMADSKLGRLADEDILLIVEGRSSQKS